MHKRSDHISLQTLILTTLGVLVAVIVIYVLAKLFIFGEAKTPADRDFYSVVEEVKDSQYAKGDRSITHPLGTDRNFDLLIQSPDSTVQISSKCPLGIACMCIRYAGRVDPLCEPLPEVKKGYGFVGMSDCPTSCGGGIVCIPGTQRFELKPGNNVVIKRTCNNLELSVI